MREHQEREETSTVAADQSVEEYLAARRYLYKAFNGIFGAEPTDQVRASWDAELVETALTILCEEEQEVWKPFASWLKKPSQDLASLGGHYNALFVGPGTPIAAPWEAMYVVRGDRRLFSPTALEVRRCYRAQGIIPQGYPHVSDDALALELDFLYALGERSLTAYQEGVDFREPLDASLKFLKMHLLKWIDRCVGSMEAYRSGSFYACAGKAAAAFTHADKRRLEQILGPAVA